MWRFPTWAKELVKSSYTRPIKRRHKLCQPYSYYSAAWGANSGRQPGSSVLYHTTTTADDLRQAVTMCTDHATQSTTMSKNMVHGYGFIIINKVFYKPNNTLFSQVFQCYMVQMCENYPSTSCQTVDISLAGSNPWYLVLPRWVLNQYFMFQVSVLPWNEIQTRIHKDFRS